MKFGVYGLHTSVLAAALWPLFAPAELNPQTDEQRWQAIGLRTGRAVQPQPPSAAASLLPAGARQHASWNGCH